MAGETWGGKGSDYRAASERLHRDSAPQERHAVNLRMLWDCGLADLIRDDFNGLFHFPPDVRGTYFDAGCGAGGEARHLAAIAPGLRVFGVDISSLRLAEAVAAGTADPARFSQAALEALPFPDGSFDFIGSHEVIEHVEDPAIVLPELCRVLKPGGVCVIATPNGASLWVGHLRQRVARLFGRRGAPVGEDHTRTPTYWRRRFAEAGFTVEERMFDGAAFEFLTYVAPASWMPLGVRLLEPLRAVSGVNLLLCDRVKYRLRKPGEQVEPRPEPAFVCPQCHSEFEIGEEEAVCASGHRFGRNPSFLIDFTASLGAGASNGTATDEVRWVRKIRRLVMAAGCLFYVVFLTLLVPFGAIAGRAKSPVSRLK